MSRSNLLILCASLLLFMLGALLVPGLLSATALAYVETVAAPPHCPLLKEYSGYSSSSERSYVKLVQNKLNSLGANLKVDGYFGPKTYGVVKEFQKSRNLDPDGEVGDHTWAALGGCQLTIAV